MAKPGAVNSVCISPVGGRDPDVCYIYYHSGMSQQEVEIGVWKWDMNEGPLRCCLLATVPIACHMGKVLPLSDLFQKMTWQITSSIAFLNRLVYRKIGN